MRPTVEALVGHVSRGTMLISAHWPKKAAVRGESNLTTPAGKWSPSHVSQRFATERRVRREYGLEESTSVQLRVVPLAHEPFAFPGRRKVYSWSWVELIGQLDDMSPNARDVASHGWYSTPVELETAIVLMHAEKALMFRRALGLAFGVDLRLAPYRGLAL